MAYLYYTITAVLLYLISDWILNKIEIYYGKRFQYRSLIFFVIIFTLSVSLFEMIDRVIGEPPQQVSPAAEEAVTPATATETQSESETQLDTQAETP
jgi:hypothetical protein